MRITESRLRRIIRQVILETGGMDDLSDPKLFSDFLDAVEDRGFNPEVLSPVNENSFRRRKLIKESFKYRNWNQYLKDLEKKNINLDAKFNSLSEEKKERVRIQAQEIRAAKGRIKDDKIRECMEILGYSAIVASMLMVLISVLCAGWAIVPAAIATKLMSVVSGKAMLGLFGFGTSTAISMDPSGPKDDRIRSDRRQAYSDPESPLHSDFLKDY